MGWHGTVLTVTQRDLQQSSIRGRNIGIALVGMLLLVGGCCCWVHQLNAQQAQNEAEARERALLAKRQQQQEKWQSQVQIAVEAIEREQAHYPGYDRYSANYAGFQVVVQYNDHGWCLGNLVFPLSDGQLVCVKQLYENLNELKADLPEQVYEAVQADADLVQATRLSQTELANQNSPRVRHDCPILVFIDSD